MAVLSFRLAGRSYSVRVTTAYSFEGLVATAVISDNCHLVSYGKYISRYAHISIYL